MKTETQSLSKPKVILNPDLLIPKPASTSNISSYSQIDSIFKEVDLLGRKTRLQAVVLRKNQMCRIWTGCLISLLKTPGTTSSFIICGYYLHCYLARLAPQPYSLMGGPGMEVVPDRLLNLKTVGDLSLSVTSSFSRGAS